MKSKKHNLLFAAITLVGFAFTVPSVIAAALSWDTVAADGAIITVGSGTWDTAKGLTGLPGSSTGSSKTADPDKDGKNNLQEFAFDGNPLSGANDGKVVGTVPKKFLRAKISETP